MGNRDDITEIMLERYVLGELSERDNERFEAELREDADLSSRVQQIREHNKVYLDGHPVEGFYQACIEKSHKTKVGFADVFNLPVLVPSAVAIFLVFALVLPQFTYFKDQNTYEQLAFDELADIRLKGIEPKLNVYKKIDDELEKLGNNGIARADEVIQLSYVAGEMEYGTILSIDGRGSVTLHFPENITDSTKLNTGGEIPLEHAYQLDDAPKYEQFFFLASMNEIEVSEALLAAQKLAENIESFAENKLDIDKNVHQESVFITKE